MAALPFGALLPNNGTLAVAGSHTGLTLRVHPRDLRTGGHRYHSLWIAEFANNTGPREFCVSPRVIRRVG